MDELEVIKDEWFLLLILVLNVFNVVWHYNLVSEKNIVWLILLFLPAIFLWRAVDEVSSRRTFNVFCALYMIWSALISVAFLIY